MSLAKRLKSIEQPRRAPRGCETCRWLATRTADDRQSIYDWIENGWSIRQLHEVLTSDPDPLTISESAFKNHLRDCERPTA